MKIGGSYTVADWKALRHKLLTDPADPQGWSEAVKIFRARIDTRFLGPIRRILSGDERGGEGFAAAALQAILVEFLQAFYDGVLYRPPVSEGSVGHRAKRLGITPEELNRHQQPNEYTSSADLFRRFLTSHAPFSENFTRSTAGIYYSDIRCGLLHEAATKGESTILGAILDRLVDPQGRGIVLHRTAFQTAIERYVDAYIEELVADDDRQRAFIRKMDDLCQIRRVYYFAYGRNLNRSCLADYVSHAHESWVGELRGYRFAYNKKSHDGSSKANLVLDAGASVWGVCYEIEDSEYRKIVRAEKGYRIAKVLVLIRDQSVICDVFISDSITSARPSIDYVNSVVQGAREAGLPSGYVAQYLNA